MRKRGRRSFARRKRGRRSFACFCPSARSSGGSSGPAWETSGRRFGGVRRPTPSEAIHLLPPADRVLREGCISTVRGVNSVVRPSHQRSSPTRGLAVSPNGEAGAALTGLCGVGSAVVGQPVFSATRSEIGVPSSPWPGCGMPWRAPSVPVTNRCCGTSGCWQVGRRTRRFPGGCSVVGRGHGPGFDAPGAGGAAAAEEADLEAVGP